ncbi:MAG: T9SS type A sorting domain-containing protein, partial [Chitinophagales bacterium]|nr:T9SS type A sorting domain-containing protein [Chitinophagales bacterium]
SIQPNPATYNTDINYWAEQNKTLKVVLYQTNGQVLMQQTYNATQGNNVFTLDLSGCNNGMYWLSVNDGTNWQQQKIVVVR